MIVKLSQNENSDYWAGWLVRMMKDLVRNYDSPKWIFRTHGKVDRANGPQNCPLTSTLAIECTSTIPTHKLKTNNKQDGCDGTNL